jgi:mxaJ protein
VERKSGLGLVVLLVAACPGPASDPVPSKASAPPAARLLRVCADPNNLPFSNRRQEGFENEIASLVAREMGARLEYTWWAQRRGFIRNTLNARACDVVVGVPSNLDLLLVTAPYYRSSYVFVTREGEPLVTSFDDPILRRLRVGVQLIGDDQANSPPAHALSARHIVRNVRGYTVYGDYREDAPPAAIMRAVAEREVDVAVVWGPLAGFYARRQRVALHLEPVSPEVDLPFMPFVFDMAMGVRHGERDLRDELDAILRRRQGEIDAILDRFGVPRLDRAGEDRHGR